jgi:hypothetical protein
MATWIWIVLAVAAVLLAVAALAVVAGRRRRRTAALRSRSRAEHERTVEQADPPRAEAELEARAKRRETLEIRRLSREARDRYFASWQSIQERFVDTPGRAVADADRLVEEVMSERGYPVDDFERRAADISVDYPHVGENYRAAHAIYLRQAEGGASTEELREAFVSYRSLFDELLDAEPAEAAPGGAPAEEPAEERLATGEERRPEEPGPRGSDEARDEGKREREARPVIREDVRRVRIDDEGDERQDAGSGTRRGEE